MVACRAGWARSAFAAVEQSKRSHRESCSLWWSPIETVSDLYLGLGRRNRRSSRRPSGRGATNSVRPEVGARGRPPRKEVGPRDANGRDDGVTLRMLKMVSTHGMVHPDVRIEVQNFGPLADAAVDLHPLTVFVGPSNAGKTYLATLISALHRASEGFPRIPAPRGIDTRTVQRAIRDKLLTPGTPITCSDLPKQVRKDILGSGFGDLTDHLERCFDVQDCSELILSTASDRQLHVSLRLRERERDLWHVGMHVSPHGQTTVEGDIDDIVLVPAETAASERRALAAKSRQDVLFEQQRPLQLGGFDRQPGGEHVANSAAVSAAAGSASFGSPALFADLRRGTIRLRCIKGGSVRAGLRARTGGAIPTLGRTGPARRPIRRPTRPFRCPAATGPGTCGAPDDRRDLRRPADQSGRHDSATAGGHPLPGNSPAVQLRPSETGFEPREGEMSKCLVTSSSGWRRAAAEIRRRWAKGLGAAGPSGSSRHNLRIDGLEVHSAHRRCTYCTGPLFGGEVVPG